MFLISPKIQIPLSELRFTFVRSSGPGGQNVNKVASKAVLRWNPGESGVLPEPVMQRLAVLYPAHWTKEGEIVITSQRTRDALKNRADCLEKLRRMILEAGNIPKPRIPTRPTRGSVLRRQEAKSRNAEKKRRRRPVDDRD